MLQNNYSQLQMHNEDDGPGLDPRYYLEVLKKRLWFLLIPLLLVSAIGSVIVILRPATYQSQGTILIESPQIPVDLVRPTVSATAAARIQVIEQRVTTRDNLLAIANKFQVFAGQRTWYGGSVSLSGTEMLDKMRAGTQIKPIELDLPRQRNNLTTIAFSVSFEHDRPEIAMRVANELMTLILGEDARARTNRATETTKFLTREEKRLQGELGTVDAQIAEFRRKNRDAVPEKVLTDLATLRAELQQKAAIYSESHPSLKGLQRQIAALEKITTQSAAVDGGLEALKHQQETIQKNLDDITQKLTIARRGETLERDQQSERLEVIEQPVLPTNPVKGSRLKLLIAVFGAAIASGAGAIFAAEALDRTIRGTSDLSRMIDSHLIVGIPYIATKAEELRTRKAIRWVALAAAVLLLAGLVATHFLWMPLDVLWEKLMLRISG